MNAVPAALEPLTRFDQFILWELQHRDGKDTKVPIDYRTGRPVSVQDPAAWLSAEKALAAANGSGRGIGFVFTERDPFFFLDIDGAAEAGGWSPLARGLVGRLAGAAVEVSQSGRGLHVIAQGRPPAHSCRNKEHGIELYTAGRFVALTGLHAQGSAAVDLTEQITAVAAEFFPHTNGSSAPAVWTTEPNEGWRGPTDDQELMARAIKARSAKGVFGSGATLGALWRADEDALGKAYPHPTKAYDASLADSALAQHLAFWTGGDCDRIFRLMMLSGLVREKWNRPDYLKATISNCVARQTKYYREQRKAEPAPLPAAGVTAPQVVNGYQYLGPEAQIDHFAGCVYVESLHRVFTPRGSLLKSEQFNAVFGGYVFQLDETANKTTKKAWEAFTESQVVRFLKADSLCFRPELETGAIVTEEGHKLVNSYVPVETVQRPGDVGPFLAHLARVLPDERDRRILLSYLAACVQYKGVKFQWAPLLQGAEGNGKTLFTRCVAYAIGNRYTHLPNARDMDNKFNAWVQGKLFIGIEDIYVPEHKREIIETLKPLITNDRIEIQAKGSDQITGDNRANFILNTNLPDAIRKTRDDRRFCVFFSAQQSAADIRRDGMSGDYFPRLYGWLRRGGYAIVAHYLTTYKIDPEFNPAEGCHRAPATSSTEQAITASLGSVEQEILEAIDENRQGFAGGWVSSMALDRLLTSIRADNKIPRNRRRPVLESLGYELHPGLAGGRSNTVIMIDGGKPRLYIRRGHAAAALKRPKQIVAAYEAAQAGEGLTG